MSTAQPAPARDKNPGQLSPLPGVTTYLTGHDGAGQAVVQEKRSGKWRSFENDNLAFNVVYTTSFPADMNDSRDVKAHDETLASGSLGLVKKNGVICRQVKFSPLSLSLSPPHSTMTVTDACFNSSGRVCARLHLHDAPHPIARFRHCP